MYSILKLNERLTYLSLDFMVKFATCRGESHKQINTRRIREGTRIIKKVDLHPEFGMFLIQEVTVTVQEKMQAN